MAIEVRVAHSAGEWHQARQLVEAYGRSLAIDLSFQDYQQELGNLETVYGPPGGAFFLAGETEQLLGCVGFRQLAAQDSEMKRLYVAPAARSRGVGRLLAITAIETAGRLGYRRMLLDTLPTMAEAQALYRGLGFAPIPAYRFNPVAGTAYMALTLQPL